jgi:hypothetical protein
MRDNKDAVVVVFVLLLFLIALTLGVKYEKSRLEEFQSQAVERGYATLTADTETREIKFEWVTKEETSNDEK